MRTPELDVETEAFLERSERRGLRSPHLLPVAAGRKALQEFQAGYADVSPAGLEDIMISAGAFGQVRIRIVRPAGLEGPLPIVMYMHGGAWVLGDVESYDRMARALAHGAEAALAFVDYTLAPEARHPTQIEQGYAALRFLAACGAELGLDPTRIAVAGDCSGGGLAAALCLLAKYRRGPEPVFQLLLCPVLADPGATAASPAPYDERWLTLAALRSRADQGFDAQDARDEPTAFPLRAGIDLLNDLPDALVIVAEHDPAREDGEEYARRLAAAGVPSTCVRYNGAIHDFMLLNGMSGSRLSRTATRQASIALREALYSPR
ncbi:alpha/beta hydrolase [Sphingomonadaceae bacterium OTU29THOMA1]|nr:alpha/beta hydrolase [Sphingomonadaceae bacterium OTU29THOMA1]